MMDMQTGASENARWTLLGRTTGYTLRAALHGDGTWSAQAVASGPSESGVVCFTAGRLASPGEALAAFKAAMALRGDVVETSDAPERTLRLPGSLVASLTHADRLLLNALAPPGRIVSRERLRRVRLDVGEGPLLRDD